MGVTAKQRELKAARVAAQSAATSMAVATEPASEVSEVEQTPTGDVHADPQRWATIETAARIVRALGEEHFTPQLLLLRITRLLGPELALEPLDEALRIDGDGGELLPSGGRYRSVGGIYFRLVRELLTPAEWAQVTCSSARASSILGASNGENPTC
jgi:hypothetical protein